MLLLLALSLVIENSFGLSLKLSSIKKVWEARFSLECLPLRWPKSNTASRYSKSLVIQWPITPKIALWFLLVHASKESDIVEHVASRSALIVALQLLKARKTLSQRAQTDLISNGSPLVATLIICLNFLFSIISKGDCVSTKNSTIASTRVISTVETFLPICIKAGNRCWPWGSRAIFGSLLGR